MKELVCSGLPIWYDEQTSRLEFRDSLTCAGGGGKSAGQLRGLLCDESHLSEKEPCYDFYRDIVFEEDRAIFRRYDYRYDITAILPGTVGGERKKTSGHYHGYIVGTASVYPEVYEVLEGEAVFLLQKVPNFDREEEPAVEAAKALRVRAGQAVIIPPLYGHCSINAGNGALFFSNIAVVSCPLHCGPVRAKHGMSYYLVEEEGRLHFRANPHYTALPPLEEIDARECPELGIEFGRPVYGAFVETPEKFDFLLHPEIYSGQMEALIAR